MVKYLNTFFSYLFFLLLVIFSLILALGKGYQNLFFEGANLYLALVVPSLFPYFFITTILSSLSATSKISNKIAPITKRLFNLSGAVGYAFFMSVLCGYPVGAKIVSDLKEKGVINQSESIRASALCSTSSPMFLIGSVGNLMFNNRKFGLVLFLSHFICAIIVGIIFSFYKRKDLPNENQFLSAKKVDNILYESAYSSVISILVVGAIIIIFYMLSQMLFSFNILSPVINFFELILKDKQLAKGLTFGLFECTQGLKIISTSKSALSLSLSAFVCGFGGISIIMQSLAYLKKAKIKTAPFLLAKLLSAVLNFCLASVLFMIFSP